MNNIDWREPVPEIHPSPWLDSGRDPARAHPARSMRLLEKLKEQLFREKARAELDSDQLASLRRAAEEAAALAWGTAYPLLMLPELFAEKAAEAFVQSERQREIRRRSRALVAFGV